MNSDEIEGLCRWSDCDKPIVRVGLCDSHFHWLNNTPSPRSLAAPVGDAEVGRADFEQWAKHAVGQPSFAGKHIRDGAWSYNHNIMDLMWRCWQAALRNGSSEDTQAPDVEMVERALRFYADEWIEGDERKCFERTPSGHLLADGGQLARAAILAVRNSRNALADI